MYKLLSVEQIRELERRADEEQGLDGASLMREAGLALCEAVIDTLEGPSQLRGDSTAPLAQKVAIFAGPGNNGGDGWSCATFLQQRGVRVTVFSVVDINDLSGIASDAAFAAVNAGVHWTFIDEAAGLEDIFTLIDGADVCVDALLGIGIRLPLDERIATITDALNRCALPVVAADVPTGVDADTGAVDERAVRADCTVTFMAAKRGLALAPAFAHTGAVMVAPLGLDESAFFDFLGVPELYTDDDLAQQVPLPALDANKYTRGRVLIIAGSRQYPGAAVLCARGAVRCGAGYVTLACPESVVSLMQAHLVTAPVVGLSETREGSISERALPMLLNLASMADAIVIGPGLDRAPKTAQLVREFVAAVNDKTLVIDADALNAFVDHPELLTSHEGSLVLTPHAGELARLLEEESDKVAAVPLDFARKLAGEKRTVVLKGPITVVSCAKVQSIDMFGPPVLATAGTGDVLAGMMTSFIAQGVDPYRAACIAVRLHGHAAIAAMEALTPLCVTSEDVAQFISVGARNMMMTENGDE